MLPGEEAGFGKVSEDNSEAEAPLLKAITQLAHLENLCWHLLVIMSPM